MVGVHHEIAQPEQPEVGVRGEREPVEQQRQELGHEPGAARQAAGEVLHRGPGARRVGEAEGGQTIAPRPRPTWPGEGSGPGGARWRAGPVGPSTVAKASSRGRKKRRSWMARTSRWQRRSASSKRAVADADASSSKPSTRASRRRAVCVGGHGMGLLLLDELQPVLHGAQEAVRVGQGGGVLGGDVPRRGQLGERAERRALPDPRVVAAVHELQELDGELDVADPPGPALDLAARRARARSRSPRCGPSSIAPRPARRRCSAFPTPARRRRARTARPSSASPATARAFNSAWNSHVAAHRSQ